MEGSFRLTHTLVWRVSLIALATATGTAARAQDNPKPTTAEADQGLTDIVVTAQRREENLQRAAIAVSAVGGQDLARANVTDVVQLSKIIPSLNVQPATGTATSFYIRGVGSFVGNAFTDNPVAFNYSGVYIARPAALLGTLYDIQRIEVLKGPQGTLYGRNATGGAVNVIPNRPVLGKRGLDVAFQVGSYNEIRAQAALNLPLGDSVALRIAGQAVSRDGYYDTGYDDEKGQAVRASLLFKPDNRFSALLVADYFHQGGHGNGAILIPGALTPNAPPPSDRIDGSDPRSVAVLVGNFGSLVTDGLASAPKRDGFVNSDFWGLAAEAKYDFGPVALTVIPAYRDSHPNYLTYSGGYSGRVDERSRQTSLEARLASKGTGALNFVGGGYFFREHQTGTNDFDTGLISRTLFSVDLTNRSYALFGQASYAVMPGFRLIAGGRYTWEEKSQDTVLTAISFGAPSISHVTGNARFRRATYKAGVEYDLGPRSLLYANVATGFKSGGFFIAALDNTFRPEKIKAYTIGSKNRFFDNRVQINIEGFYWDYRDQQVNYVGPVRNADGSTGTGLVTTNAGKSRIYGAEAEIRFQPTPRNLISIDAQYLNGRYSEFNYVASSPSGAPPRTACVVTPSNAFTLPAPGQAYLIDCAGKPQINTPKLTSSIQVEHRIPIREKYELTIGGRAKLETSRYLSPEYLPEERQGKYALLDAFVTMAIPASRISVTGFVNNITNRTLYAGTNLRPVLPVVYNILQPPRTYGVRVAGSF